MEPEDPYSIGALRGPPAIEIGPGWRRFAPRAEIIIRRVVAALCGGQDRPEAVILASDRAVRQLNRRYRGKNKPTNVLSFPAPDGGPTGEIVLALGVLRREARQMRLPVAAHLAHLMVHAVLHLQGYDHHHPSEAREMEMRESVVLRRLGFANPWKRGRASL